MWDGMGIRKSQMLRVKDSKALEWAAESGKEGSASLSTQATGLNKITRQQGKV